MCERIRALIIWRRHFRKELAAERNVVRLQRKLQRAENARRTLADQRIRAEHHAACLLMDRGPIDFDRKHYSAVRLHGDDFPAIRVEPLEPEAVAAAVGERNCPGLVP